MAAENEAVFHTLSLLPHPAAVEHENPPVYPAQASEREERERMGSGELENRCYGMGGDVKQKGKSCC